MYDEWKKMKTLSIVGGGGGDNDDELYRCLILCTSTAARQASNTLARQKSKLCELTEKIQLKSFQTKDIFPHRAGETMR